MGQLTVKESNLMFALTAGFLKLQYKRFKAMKKSEISCSIQKINFLYDFISKVIWKRGNVRFLNRSPPMGDRFWIRQTLIAICM